MEQKIHYCDHVFPETRTPKICEGLLTTPRKCVVGELKVKSGKKGPLREKDQETKKQAGDQQHVFKAALGALLTTTLVWYVV